MSINTQLQMARLCKDRSLIFINKMIIFWRSRGASEEAFVARIFSFSVLATDWTLIVVRITALPLLPVTTPVYTYVMQKILRHIALATHYVQLTHESALSRKLCCTLQRVYRTGVETINYTRISRCHRPICTWRNLVANSEFWKGNFYTKHDPH